MKAFDCDEFERYKAEAKENWGKTEAYKQYADKTEHYTKDKWNALAEGMNEILAGFAECMNEGEANDGAKAQSLVKKLQRHITEGYYTCINEILAGLGQMYVLDERFKNNIDKHGVGTAEYISEAIKNYCGNI